MPTLTLVSGDGGEGFDRDTAFGLRNVLLDAAFGQMAMRFTEQFVDKGSEPVPRIFVPLGKIVPVEYVQN